MEVWWNFYWLFSLVSAHSFIKGEWMNEELGPGSMNASAESRRTTVNKCKGTEIHTCFVVFKRSDDDKNEINQSWDWFGGRSAVMSTTSSQSQKHIPEHCNITTLKSHSTERFVWCYWHVCKDAAVITWTNICSLLCLIKKEWKEPVLMNFK